MKYVLIYLGISAIYTLFTLPLCKAAKMGDKMMGITD